ncbi:HAD-IA family hydrolase [Paenibacillus sp. Marseille-P2973]|uniref:HAD family hydrolase n=1 Tax=Paenibacillus sp. Marseille-P2973 TaxID=1871032 RepID=UPI001B399435|nr:HAD-IA family hydrolase [Paenibacillus sp. Marseille-P2973]MBQ4898807.1 HAD-IA family hydrolase [Paenibacillus sp. Marseille-P2973]
MIRSVIFDLDGTLLDRNISLYRFLVDQYDRIIKNTKNIDKESYIHRFIELDHRGYVWKDRVYQELIKEFDLPLDWNELLTDYKIGFCKHATPFPNTTELLENLIGKGYKLGMITNGFGDFQSSNIQALGIQEYFEVILISEIEGIRKPDPAIFNRASDLLGVRPEECVYVGDHPINDVTASKSAGMKGIWKEDTFYNDDFKYDGIVRDLLDIEKLIEQWS